MLSHLCGRMTADMVKTPIAYNSTPSFRCVFAAVDYLKVQADVACLKNMHHPLTIITKVQHASTHIIQRRCSALYQTICLWRRLEAAGFLSLNASLHRHRSY